MTETYAEVTREEWVEAKLEKDQSPQYSVTEELWGRGELKDAVQYLDSVGITYGKPEYFWSIKITGRKFAVQNARKKFSIPTGKTADANFLPPAATITTTLTFYNDAPEATYQSTLITATKVALQGIFFGENPPPEFCFFVLNKPINVTAYNCSPASAPVVSLKVEATGFPGPNPTKADATAIARATEGIKRVWSSTKYCVVDQEF